MKGDHTKFFVSQKYVKNTKFGSYLHHQHVSVLYSKQHRTLPSESWSVLSLSLLESLLQKSWKSKNVAPHPPVIKTNQ